MGTIISTVISVLATVICTIIGVIFIPAVTVLLETLTAVRNNRDHLIALLDKFNQVGKAFLQSKTDDEWNRGRITLFQIDQDMGQISRSLSPYIPRPLFLDIGSFRFALLLFWDSTHSLPAKDSEQWLARQTAFQTLEQESCSLRMAIRQAGKSDEFAKAIRNEIKETYYSIWVFIVHSLRRCFTTRNRMPYQD